jgi:hypothetical protein
VAGKRLRGEGKGGEMDTQASKREQSCAYMLRWQVRRRRRWRGRWRGRQRGKRARQVEA